MFEARYIFSCCCKASNIVRVLSKRPSTSSKGQGIPRLTHKKDENNYESTCIISEEQGLVVTKKLASHHQTLRVVSDEQETSVLSPTRTASLT